MWLGRLRLHHVVESVCRSSCCTPGWVVHDVPKTAAVVVSSVRSQVVSDGIVGSVVIEMVMLYIGHFWFF
jgi:hypothetical protein